MAMMDGRGRGRGRGRDEERKTQTQKYLPLELCREVLARVPVKTLLRFRCVSKTWCSMIDHPKFTSLQRAVFKDNNSFPSKRSMFLIHVKLPDNGPHHSSETRLVTRRNHTLFSESTSDDDQEIVSSLRHLHFEIFDCLCYLDGLLLMRHIAPLSLVCKTILWNPSIRKYVELPPIVPPPELPRYSPSRVLLGYDPLTDDYKVVLIHSPTYHPSTYCLLAVYALKTRCWRLHLRYEDYINLHNLWSLGHPSNILTKGFAHWSVCEKTKSVDPLARIHTHIASFDFASERISCTRLPDDGGDDIDQRITLPFSINDSLAVFIMSPGHRRRSIWVMEKPGTMIELWSQQDARDSYLSSYQFFKKNKLYVSCLLYDVDDQGCRKFLFRMSNNERVKSYDLESQEIKDVGYNNCRYMESHVESLLLHKGS